MAAFEQTLLSSISDVGKAMAWCILPNHYHVLVEAPDIFTMLLGIGRMHGRVSHQWNGEDGARGRKCWHGCAERAMRSLRHQRVTLNYIHHNPVHHRYVRNWQDWPFSSAKQFLDNMGREVAMRHWQEYPLMDYGKGWDDPDK